jgi:O-antigen chain-terminating methyltransferase
MNLQGPRSSAPPPDDAARLAGERAEADRRYNEALTALDEAIVGAGARSALERHDIELIATTLIVFLQQITAFVETKDREAQAKTAHELSKLAASLENMSELRTQVSVLQRSIAALTRTRQPAPGTVDTAPGTLRPAPTGDGSPLGAVRYVGFEDAFRGSDAAIAERLAAYIPLFGGASNVVDLGCGRGEFVAALDHAGIPARGVDLNPEMVEVARDRGLDVVVGDALTFLEAQADESLGGLMAAQVVEHLEPAYLVRLIDSAATKLKPGAPIVLETINAACWLAFFSSYIRDLTHVRPIHPETLQFLLRAAQFERVTIRYSSPVSEEVRMQPVHLPAELLAAGDPPSRALTALTHTINANMTVLNNLMFTHLDYAAIGYRT